ncbi:MAG: UDP-N-acetylmuramoyl-L-alanyl-D-glutamate--2,6-diaminopimelate ligase [Alphaproteobacteria bacterium]|nr:UDP-N-acetylmuramoyl-L-alanyl-D-glutamate--2,6-diaminopimelate ligase [Alphaproteobacteria bacterium]
MVVLKTVLDWIDHSQATEKTHTPTITDLTSDSRQVKPGCLFFALAGEQTSGACFIDAAIKNGASAVIVDETEPLSIMEEAVPIVRVKNARRALAKIAGQFFDPGPEACVAVTGTDGKSSTVSFTRQIWTSAGLKAASLGTLGLDAPDLTAFGQPKFGLTTPDPIGLHKLLGALKTSAVTHVAMEASSHGLDQFRIDGVRLNAAGFTNLSQDHLDYHGTMEKYFEAKARLFHEVLLPDGVAVLNADIPEYEALMAICKKRGLKVFNYGRNAASLRLEKLTACVQGYQIEIMVLGRPQELLLPLVGQFQIYNSLCALGLALATGIKEDVALNALTTLKGVAGRLQKVGTTSKGALIYVDYAHTPDAMEAVLTSMKPHCLGKMICVFGCGGDRDRLKRPLMGRIACKYADRVIVTDDNPRSEDPASIRGQILQACDANAIDIGGREDAIKYAIEQSGANDMVLILGKGHEHGQIVGHQVLPFDDVQVARACIGF